MSLSADRLRSLRCYVVPIAAQDVGRRGRCLAYNRRPPTPKRKENLDRRHDSFTNTRQAGLQKKILALKDQQYKGIRGCRQTGSLT